MLRIAVLGANGRMGRNLIRAILQDKSQEICLTTALVRQGSPFVGKDVSCLVDVQDTGIILRDNLEAEKDHFDIIIDFTRPCYSLDVLSFCATYHKKLVLGTTGFSEQEKLHIQQMAQHTAIIFAPNFSVGVNLVFKLLEKASLVMGESCDIEIIEAHHRHKVDSPSGTALAMGECISQALGKNLSDLAVYDRHCLFEERKQGEIGFSTIRAGDVVGEHSVWFVNEGERVEITHKASSRMTFAMGAVRACKWLACQSKGLFDMTDVLGLDKF